MIMAAVRASLAHLRKTSQSFSFLFCTERVQERWWLQQFPNAQGRQERGRGYGDDEGLESRLNRWGRCGGSRGRDLSH